MYGSRVEKYTTLITHSKILIYISSYLLAREDIFQNLHWTLKTEVSIKSSKYSIVIYTCMSDKIYFIIWAQWEVNKKQKHN